MPHTATKHKVTQNMKLVNPGSDPPVQLAFPGMEHHNVTPRTPYILVSKDMKRDTSFYGVSKSRKVLTPGLLLKRWNHIQKCLAGPLGLTYKQADVVNNLLRLWAYYGLVYPKAEQLTDKPTERDLDISFEVLGFEYKGPRKWCRSKSTVWRTIRKLKAWGLIEVVNRFMFREKAQTSNLYKLDKLIIVLARYLAEHGQVFKQQWLRHYLNMPSFIFWSISSRVSWELAIHT